MGSACRLGSGGESERLEEARREMIERQLRRRGIHSPQVLDAMRAVPRHEFVPADCRAAAHSDQPLPIGLGQTISQPLMVATMTEALGLIPRDRVLEIGTGSGYQTAVLSLLAGEVYSIEYLPELAEAARQRLARLGFTNIRVREGDGGLGWPEAAPFDAILVAAAAPEPPAPLIDQLAEGGRMVIPAGCGAYQELLRIERRAGRIRRSTLDWCRFVPLRGRYGWEQPFPTEMEDGLAGQSRHRTGGR